MQSATPLLWPIVALLAGCAGIPDRSHDDRPRVRLRATDQPRTAVSLEPGTRIELLPAATSGAGQGQEPLRRTRLDGLWRQAMDQSVRFDVAAGVERCASKARIRLHVDVAARSFTTTLERDGKSPVALAAVRSPDLHDALDRLAWLSRAALGESIGMAPVRSAAAYSADATCVHFTELGLRQGQQGAAETAFASFERARSHDGGCAVTLLHLAAATARRGGDANIARAETIAREALGLRDRLTPRTEHLLARLVLEVRRDDAKLGELGRAYASDRPHDPHGKFTIALARLRSGEHAAAAPMLEELAQRWPENAFVRYQLCFALLGSNKGRQALAVLEEARAKLPPRAIVRPYAMALFHADKHAALERYLESLRTSKGIANTTAERELLRMQASHAILSGKRELAVKKLAATLDWVRQRHSTLARYSLDVAEDGEVLARLGAQPVLRQAIDGFQQLGHLPPSFANVLTYLGGILDVGDGRVPQRALDTLEKSNDSVWHNRLAAAVHHRRGELEAETKALTRAVAASRSPLLHANVARALEAAGKSADARRIADHVRSELLTFDQRRPYEHPLMTPGRAMAFVATK